MTLAKDRQEQRRYRRIQLSVPARFLAEGGMESSGTLLDISPGGLALSATERPPIGAAIVVYVDQLGRVEGHVVRHVETGFAVELAATDAKRERLSARLDSLTNHMSKDGEAMEPIRVSARTEKPHFILEDGREIECRVLDMSMHGVWLQVGIRPPVGEEVKIGRMRGRVRCHHPTGVEIEFLRAGA